MRRTVRTGAVVATSATGGKVTPAFGDGSTVFGRNPAPAMPDPRSRPQVGDGASRRRTLRQVTQPSSLMYSLMATFTSV